MRTIGQLLEHVALLTAVFPAGGDGFSQARCIVTGKLGVHRRRMLKVEGYGTCL